MKKLSFIILLLLLSGLPLFSLPPSLENIDWHEFNFSYTFTFPFGHNGGLRWHYVYPGQIGFGFSVILGYSLVELTINFISFVDIPGNQYLSIPISIRAGYVNLGAGIIIQTGIRGFFGEMDGDGIPSNAGCFFSEVLLGGFIAYREWPDPEHSSNLVTEFLPCLFPPAGICASLNFGFCDALQE
ncbi:MAG: hypothetical protein EHM28_00880 [Spirochaetaceae bacterium]|nr:MAG: hypothetical protein EHM28_00880 [Spirochaetaceae bacterium]